MCLRRRAKLKLLTAAFTLLLTAPAWAAEPPTVPVAPPPATGTASTAAATPPGHVTPRKHRTRRSHWHHAAKRPPAVVAHAATPVAATPIAATPMISAPLATAPAKAVIEAHAAAPLSPAPRPGLTPYGAIQAANETGTIPAWTGGIATPPAGYVSGGAHPDPFAGEKKLFSITSANITQYAMDLTPGVQAMLREYPNYRLDIYPTHRSFAVPQSVLDAATANATRAHLAADGNSVVDARITIPFPVPHSGLEAIWNHLLRFRAYQAHFTGYSASPTAAGDYTLIKNDTRFLFRYAQGVSSDSGVMSYYMIKTLSPALYAGQITLANDFLDPKTHPREAWIYSPGESRVRRAPEVNFDTPQVQADSLATDDDLDVFNGSPERYNWHLLGREEMYIPYNDYAFGDASLNYSDLLKPQFINPDYMRWELHRVWVVDATLKPGFHHVYPHRTFYFDEDSWEGVLAEDYDRRGQIWRVISGAPTEFYEVPVLINGSNIFYDLQARRYHARGLRNRDSVVEFTGPKMQAADFTPTVLREEGVR
jgi:hypothetical protein